MIKDTLGWIIFWLASCISERPMRLSTYLEKCGWEQISWWTWIR